MNTRADEFLWYHVRANITTLVSEPMLSEFNRFYPELFSEGEPGVFSVYIVTEYLFEELKDRGEKTYQAETIFLWICTEVGQHLSMHPALQKLI